jgi:hypothetical protein
MSYAEIEAELDTLEADELRRLALKSRTAFIRKEGRADGVNECDESDPHLLRRWMKPSPGPTRLRVREIRLIRFAPG